MSQPSEMFELTVDANPQVEDGVMTMSGEGINLSIAPSNTFPTVIPGMKATVTIDFTSILGQAQTHSLK